MGDRWGAAFVRIGWQASFGLGGSFAPDWVAGITGIRRPVHLSSTRAKLVVIMRISSYALPQRAAHFSEGTALVSRFGATPEQREATLALLKTRNRLNGCFSKTEQMHDLVIGLFMNRYEFGLPL